jgi:outer membrane receptor protein involved in Fe transport
MSFSGDPSQHLTDGRSLVSANYKRRAGLGELRWRLSYDRYHYDDRFDYPVDGAVEVIRDFNLGDWVDSELTYEFPVSGVGPLTVGLKSSVGLRSEQYNLVDGVRDDMTARPDRTVAVFAQQQWDLAAHWRLYGGVRLDHSRNYDGFVSPRLAAVYQPSPRMVYKLVYGRPFRNPSAFEQFYNDGGLSYAAAPPLHPEAADTFEASAERQITRRMSLVSNVFHYRIARVIDAATLNNGVLQYQNQAPIRSTGLELEWSGKFGPVEATASTVFQSASGGDPVEQLENSPRNLSKARVGWRLFRDRLMLAGAMQSLSRRLAQCRAPLGGAVLADFTSTVRVHSRFDLQAGVRNALDRRYLDPVYLSVDHLRGDGRSLFVRLIWRVWE